MTESKKKIICKHRFHLVTRSPWPLFASIGALAMAVGAVMYFHNYQNGFNLLMAGFSFVLLIASLWWRDVIRESTFEGRHTLCVQKGLRMGFILFIVSEVMLFFSFFWSYFHAALSPTVELGCIWPPLGITPFDPWSIPLLNTLILLLSGSTITVAHYSILLNDHKKGSKYFYFTIALAAIFTLLQLYEYITAPFAISDGVYGSVFYMITGLHGFHVIVGTIFIIVVFIRYLKRHFTPTHHLGFEFAAWYWHFVDFVWIYVFLTLYWWASTHTDQRTQAIIKAIESLVCHS